MSALLYGPYDLRIENMGSLEPGEGEVLVEVEYCGVCPTDLRFFTGVRRPKSFPTKMGHEISGRIVSIGPGVSQLDQGQHVSFLGRVGCGQCAFCKRGYSNHCEDSRFVSGGFSQLMICPASNVVVSPKSLPLKETCLAEPVGCCVSALEKLTLSDESTAIVIGDGPIGLIFVQLLRLAHVKSVCQSGHHRERLEFGKRIGADLVFDTSEGPLGNAPSKLLPNMQFDTVVVAAPNSSAISEGLAVVSRLGQVLIFANPYPPENLNLDLDSLHKKELTILGSHECAVRHMEKALRYMSDGSINVGSSITNVFSFGKLTEAFNTALIRKSMKVVVTPNH